MDQRSVDGSERECLPPPCWGHPEDLRVPCVGGPAWSPLSESGPSGSSGSPWIQVGWECGLPRLPSKPPPVRGQQRNSVPGGGKLPGSGRQERAPSGPWSWPGFPRPRARRLRHLVGDLPPVDCSEPESREPARPPGESAADLH